MKVGKLRDSHAFAHEASQEQQKRFRAKLSFSRGNESIHFPVVIGGDGLFQFQCGIFANVINIFE